MEWNNSHIEKIENYVKEKCNEVALNHLKNQMIKELTSEMSDKSIEKDLIKSLISWKSTENPVTIQTPDSADPKNPLKEIQKEKKNMGIKI